MLLNKTKIAIAGLGTVGSGVLKLFKKSLVHKKYGIELSAVASRRKLNFNDVCFKNYKFFKDASELLNFDDYDILIELIGGEEGVSKKLVFDALKKGKKVVTANKALVSKHWHKIKQLTKNDLSQIKFEAAVAGGIPIIKILNDFLISNKIKNIYGILNGTSNFILTNMLSSKEKFDKILAKAQSLGYAESDPSFDIDGIDTAHKLSILCSLSYNVNCNLNNIYIEGIRNIDLTDILYAEELGYSVKLLGITKIKNRKLINFVYPCLIDKDQLIAKVDGVYNGIVVESDFCKKSFFQGEGAGSFPTATSVMSDIIDLSLNKSKKILFKKKELPYFQISERFGSYYLRFSTADEPGVISGISNEFKSNNISMKSMLQKENFLKNDKHATIVLTTHNCFEKDMINALKSINKMKFIKKKTTFIRIEGFK